MSQIYVLFFIFFVSQQCICCNEYRASDQEICYASMAQTAFTSTILILFLYLFLVLFLCFLVLFFSWWNFSFAWSSGDVIIDYFSGGLFSEKSLMDASNFLTIYCSLRLLYFLFRILLTMLVNLWASGFIWVGLKLLLMGLWVLVVHFFMRWE